MPPEAFKALHETATALRGASTTACLSPIREAGFDVESRLQAPPENQALPQLHYLRSQLAAMLSDKPRLAQRAQQEHAGLDCCDCEQFHLAVFVRASLPVLGILLGSATRQTSACGTHFLTALF